MNVFTPAHTYQMIFMKKLCILFLLNFCFSAWTLAQRTVTGIVKDSDGLPLFSANVIEKGTINGTTTDFDGAFELTLTTDNPVLTISFTGFETQEIDMTGQDFIEIMLSEGQLLQEIVITALGIEKESKTLGYSIDQIKSEELTKAPSTNIVNALQGKVTGVNINNTDGNLGGSSKIIIRGATSLSGNNDPLWVVDGIPINNDQIISTATRVTGNRDFGNGASVINPNDVESVNILKGAAATALYGSRAAAGVVMITTKKGEAHDDGNARVEFSSTFRVDDLFVTPDYQQQYAMGNFSKYDSASIGIDWGPPIVGQTVSSLPIRGGSGVLRPVENNGIDRYYRTGNTIMNSLAISDADEKFNYRIGLGALNQTGILPGATLDRYNATLNTGFNHSKKLRSNFGIQFISTNSKGTGATGVNDPNVISFSDFSSTLDPALFDPWIDEAGNQINQAGPITNNYLWLRNENRNDRSDTRIIGNISTTYDILENLNITARYGYDFNQDSRFISNRKGTIQRLQGDYIVNDINNIQKNLDIIANYKTTLSDKIDLNVIAGYNYNNRRRKDEGLTGRNLLIPELFSPGNTAQTIPSRFFSERVLFGAYASADFTYDNWATLTITGRNDWSSTLPINNNSYFYPSVSAAVIFSEALGLQSDFFNYGKLRASFARVGNDTGPYQLDFVYTPVTIADGQYNLNIVFPFDDRLAFTKTVTIPPANLRPEQQTSYEIGAELDFLDYRVGVDFAVFKTENRDQILALPIPESTGFGFIRTNVGQVNTSGVEFSIDALAVKSNQFSWNTLVNFSSSKVKVVELAESVDRVLIASGFNNVQVIAEEGKGFELFAIPFLRDEATGRPLINPNDGTRLAGAPQAMGSVLPDFTMGFVNSFDYGPLNLSFTIDWRSGGVMKSSTVENLQTGGLVEETLLNREGTFIDREGVIANADGSVRDNDIPLASAADFWRSLNRSTISEAFIFDASFVKLRELAISYTLPEKIFKNTFVRNLSIGIEGRNLALLYSKVPHIDPENNLFGSGVDGFGIEGSSIPTTRSLGFNLRATF